MAAGDVQDWSQAVVIQGTTQVSIGDATLTIQVPEGQTLPVNFQTAQDVQLQGTADVNVTGGQVQAEISNATIMVEPSGGSMPVTIPADATVVVVSGNMDSTVVNEPTSPVPTQNIIGVPAYASANTVETTTQTMFPGSWTVAKLIVEIACFSDSSDLPDTATLIIWNNGIPFFYVGLPNGAIPHISSGEYLSNWTAPICIDCDPGITFQNLAVSCQNVGSSTMGVNITLIEP